MERGLITSIGVLVFGISLLISSIYVDDGGYVYEEFTKTFSNGSKVAVKHESWRDYEQATIHGVIVLVGLILSLVGGFATFVLWVDSL
jgi:hypothetical protein